MKKTLLMMMAYASLTLFAGESLHAETFTGEVRDLKDNSLLYNMSSEITQNGDDMTRKNTFTSTSGDVAYVEEGTAKKGVIQKYTADQKQTGEKGEITVNGNEVKFIYTDTKGKKKESKEKLESNFVVAPTLIPYLHAHWDELLAGKKIEIRYGVWFRNESVGFRMYKSKEVKYKDRPAIEVIMNPSAWIIRQLVDDLTFTFDLQTKQLVTLKGRVPPKKKSGDKWKDLDALTIYNVKL